MKPTPPPPPAPEDLSVLDRRGELSAAEARRLRVYRNASGVVSYLDAVGRDFDAMPTEDQDDARRLAGIVERAVATHQTPRSATRRSAARRLAPLIAILIAMVGATAAAFPALFGGALLVAFESARGAPAPKPAEPSPRRVLALPSPRDPAPPASPATSAPDVPATAPTSQGAREPTHSIPAPTAPRAASSAERAPDAAALFAAANVQRKQGRVADALRGYAELEARHPGSAEALLARVLSGRLLLQSGKPEQADAAFRGYLSRTPSGSLAEEALQGRASALRALGRHAEERAIWQTLLSRFPRSLYAAPARERLNELQ